MPPKAAKKGSSVFVVVNGNGIDSVYTTGELASVRADALKADATEPGTIKVELHKVKDEEETASAEPPTKSTTAAKKTKSPEEQRAINAEKPSKSSDDHLPENMKALLSAFGDVLSGKSIVVTGVPPTLQRKNAEKLVMNYGGKLVKSISKNTSFVVLGNDAGPKKLEQIEDLGIEALDEDAFVALLEAGGDSKRPAEDEQAKPAKPKRQKR